MTPVTILLTIICIAIGYILGGIPTGYFVARLRGLNIREMGSGNIGATNILRSMGRIPAAIVVLLDPLKAALAVLIAIWLNVGPWGVALTGLATLLGNMFNPFLGFKGGKGVATSLGMFMPIDPLTSLACICIGVFGIAIGRFVSLSALTGIFAAFFLHLKGDWTWPTLLLVAAVFGLTMYTHRQNLGRLSQGVESRIGAKAKE